MSFAAEYSFLLYGSSFWAIGKGNLLLKENIPIIMVYGDSDSVVPYSENGALLEKCYREGGGTLVAIGKEGCGHHPHCLPDNAPIIEFIEKYAV